MLWLWEKVHLHPIVSPPYFQVIESKWGMSGTSCLLFHGPGARQAALLEAKRIGKLVADPFGDKGLKVDEARTFVSLMKSTPVGDGIGVVMAGPMDQAQPRTSDVLLKVVEEFPAHVIRPILWATDLGGVMKTIQSRCLDIWCPITEDLPVDEELEKAALSLVEAHLRCQAWKVPPLVASMKDRLPALLGEMAGVLIPRMEEARVRDLWGHIRDVSRWYNPTVIEVVGALFPPSKKVQ